MRVGNWVETGGYGLMGSELANIMPIRRLGHKDIEIRDIKSVKSAINPNDKVLHLAAMVDTVRAQQYKDDAYQANVIGARNVSSVAETLYVSTDYVFDGQRGNYSEIDAPNPVNYYGLTKLLGEYEVLRNGGKVLRLSFKPRPYKHPRVPIEMYFSGGYVDDMAKRIKYAMEHFDELPQVTHVGITRISLVELARQTRDIEVVSLRDLPCPLPRDTSFDLSVWNNIWKD